MANQADQADDMMADDVAGLGSAPVPGCVFCTPSELNAILTQTPHFRVVADFAPLVAGHTLIIPRGHFACYGAVPLAFEDELVALKRRVARFFRARYRPAIFFEHGIFRQTVFHAHLHAFPFGPLNLPVFELAHPDGRPVRRLADVHAWYNERGHYFYVEQARVGEAPLEAAIFPPEEERYFHVLHSLREQASAHGGWAPAAVRRMTGGPAIAALAEAWRAWERDEPRIE
jgi:diadenosine tetraphosphate (Ap4A) HIT family hydrolase